MWVVTPMKTNIPADVYLSPSFVAERFEAIREKYGDEQSLKLAKLKAERELWITAAFSLGLSKLTGKLFWVSANPEDSAPDTYVVTFRQKEKGQVKEITNVEVFEWEDHSRGPLLGAIRKKLTAKKYPDYFTLLCYVHGHDGERADLETIFQTLQTEKLGIAEMWLLSSIEDQGNDHALVRLYPERARIDFVYKEEVRAQHNRADIIQTARGLGMDFVPLGKLRIPIP